MSRFKITVWKESLLFTPYSTFLFKVVPEVGAENNSFKCSLCEGICQLSGRCSFFLFLMRHSFLNILSLLFFPLSLALVLPFVLFFKAVKIEVQRMCNAYFLPLETRLCQVWRPGVDEKFSYFNYNLV